MTFIESPRFPERLAQDAESEINFRNTVVESINGKETININWQSSLNVFDVSTGINTIEQLEEISNFFLVCRGNAFGFRFKNPIDFTSTNVGGAISSVDQEIGTGNGSETEFQLIKTYSVGAESSYVRKVFKPVFDTVRIAIDGIETNDFIVDELGVVTLVSAPSSGVTITAGFEFDYPVRFQNETLSTRLSNYNSAEIPLNIKEIRL